MSKRREEKENLNLLTYVKLRVPPKLKAPKKIGNKKKSITM
jgi:hypothetical protein